MELASSMDLQNFFDQWLYKPGALKLNATWQYNKNKKELNLSLNQTQQDGSLFKMPIQVAIYLPNQKLPLIKTIAIADKATVSIISIDAEPEKVVIDPESWVLMDATISKK